MISKIAFKNYKLFKQKQELKLRPMTILIGKNNTGKSAILKLMPLLESSLSGKHEEPINLREIDVHVADYPKELIYGKAIRGLEFEIYYKKSAEGENRLNITLFADDNKFHIEKWELNENLKLFKEENHFLDISENQWKPDFKGFRLELLLNADSDKASGDVPSEQPTEKDLFTDFISGVRDEAKSNYLYEGIQFDKSGLKGENLYHFLIEDSQTTDKKYFNEISDWVKEKFEGWELKIEYDGYRKDLPALIFLEKDHLRVNLSQTGIGISQILPLIIRSYKPCEKETLIIVEEPEGHLHPYAHAQIAQLFSDSLKLDKNKRYLIETHSQNFVLRIRRLIAEGIISSNDIGIYYVDYDEQANASELKEIRIDERGGVEWWPDGVFGESVIEARKIYNAQVNDLRNVDKNI